MPISSRAALLVIDVQNDFIPGGQLPVPEGDLIVPLINRTRAPVQAGHHCPGLAPARPCLIRLQPPGLQTL